MNKWINKTLQWLLKFEILIIPNTTEGLQEQTYWDFTFRALLAMGLKMYILSGTKAILIISKVIKIKSPYG